MSVSLKLVTKTALLSAVSLLVAFSGSAVATPLALPDTPLFLPDSVPPLNMIVLGRDHKLYYEAYNDYSDLDEDGTLDTRYKPSINYYGYFDSLKCYTHDGTQFNPTRATTTKKCGGDKEWSGDFLNYLTTSRIDALRKVLYGGYRSTDTATDTVLERSEIPQNAHSWGKEYTSVAVDGYDIRDYTPYSVPTPSGRRHLFANTTPLYSTNAGKPLLRVLQNRSERIWQWVSTERAVAGNCLLTGQKSDGTCNSGGTAVTPTDLQVRVKVCVSGMLEDSCARYPDGNYKPRGLLQEFGENDSMYFGLISGSYSKNTSGGVLRREMGSIKDEINTNNGVFLNGVTTDKGVTADKGIITTLNRLRNTGFGGDFQYNCGWDAAARPITEGECQMWGNPIGEMMYESMRYFAGQSKPTDAFKISYGAGEESTLPGKGLPVADWDNPYSGRPVCSKPFETVVSDINPSYDTDQLPGADANFGSFGDGDLPGLNVSALGQKIWDTEFGGERQVFIGQSGSVSDGAPTAKKVTSFGNIRGLSPEEPTKQGGYYSASVAYYGKTHDLNSADGEQKVSTFSVALASPLPKIEIPVNGKTITLVPFAKSVAGSNIDATAKFQPTDQIVDFYVDTLTSTHGIFRVNFEDVEQGADHDMDAIAVYEYTVSGDDVTVKVTSEYAAGGITQHMGYVISGTDNKDGIYLEVLDQRDGDTPGDVDYFLDTPPAFTGKPPAPDTGIGKWKDGQPLPFDATRTFHVGATSGAQLLKDPLWYAAKWGGFDESFYDKDKPRTDTVDVPDVSAEWDADNNGQPDNYFLVTNALKLSQQLRTAFQDILRKTTSSSSASVNSGSISSETRIFQAKFNTGEWTGELLSYALDPTTGDLATDEDGKIDPDWEASGELPAAKDRHIVTVNTDGTAVPFEWQDLDTTRQGLLGANELVLNYLRGDAANEGQGTTNFRARKTKLGDIVSSSPLFVGRPPFRYRDSLEAEPYSKFASDNVDRKGMVYAGANDGMLHGFDAGSGEEVFAFVPSAAYPNLKKLTAQGYSHQFFVDGAPSMGDAFFNNTWHTVLAGGLNKGGQEIYALDITDPGKLKTAEDNPDSVVLWEFTDNDDADLGLTYSQPSIVKLHNGKWAAVFGNGYNNTATDLHPSTTGDAVLYVVDIETGKMIAKLDTGAGVAQDPTKVGKDNGLATPALVDLNGDRIIDYAFAGDLYGNMWKFDLTSAKPADWKVAFADASDKPLPLYQALDANGKPQPITVRPEVARGPQGAGMIVLFGTGKYLENSDKLLTPERPQSFYGIIDRNTGADSDRIDTPRETTLTQQQIIAEQSVDLDGTDGPLAPINIRATTDTKLGANRGWYIDLVSPVLPYQAEKQVSNPIVRNGHIVFTTLIPDKDPCAFGGGSWIMELNLLDGSRLATTPFDINRDGKFSDTDMVEIVVGGKKVMVPISGLGSTEGILQSPGVIEGEIGPGGEGQSVQFKYLPGSSGNIQRVTENPGTGGTGRQSWRQVR